MKEIKASFLKQRVSVRPGPARRLARELDKLVSQVQEWLEAPHARWEENIACTILALVAGYFLVRLCACLI